jgi:hypothetical protein
MKTDRVFLCEWLGDVTDSYNDIPWPMVHEWVGYECIRWINSQNHHDAQLILEKNDDPLYTGMFKLYAEFYQPVLRTEFALRFDK